MSGLLLLKLMAVDNLRLINKDDVAFLLLIRNWPGEQKICFEYLLQTFPFKCWSCWLFLGESYKAGVSMLSALTTLFLKVTLFVS